MSAKVVQRNLVLWTSFEPSPHEAQEAFGLGVEGVTDDVKVEAVLDDLRLRYPVERDARAADGLVTG